MSRETIVLVALAAGRGAAHSPVQVQKLLFLFEKRAAEAFNGAHFNFRPYDYGPFDPDVYRVLDDLRDLGLVEIVGLSFKKDRRYKLTDRGQIEGLKLLEQLAPRYQKFVVDLSNFVRSLTFSQLVSVIYREYPEMKANSIFND